MTDRPDDVEKLEREKLELEIRLLRDKMEAQKKFTGVIEPNRFYEASDLKQILRGRVKVEQLRRHGLVGLASGYWGSNITDAIDKHCVSLAAERDPVLPRMEVENGKIFEKGVDGKSRSVVGHGEKRGKLESRRKERRIQLDRDRERELESQLSEFGGRSETSKIQVRNA